MQPIAAERFSDMIRTILVPLTTELPSEALLDAALFVAKQLNGHIRPLYIQAIRSRFHPTADEPLSLTLMRPAGKPPSL